MMKLVHTESPSVTKAKHGLGKVGSGEVSAIEGWLEYGAALLELREEYPRTNDFGEELERLGLNEIHVKLNNGLTKTRKVHPNARAAAIWAAEYPDQFKQAWEAMPDSVSIHVIHEYWKTHYRLKPVEVGNTTACISKPAEAPKPEPYDWDAHVASEPEPVDPVVIKQMAPVIDITSVLPARKPVMPAHMPEKTVDERKRDFAKIAIIGLLKELENNETSIYLFKQLPEWKKLCDLIDTYKHVIDYQNSLD